MQKEDYTWFIENINELVKKYNNRYIAIKDKNVIYSSKNEISTFNEALKIAEEGTFIIKKCEKRKKEKIYIVSGVAM